jgi:two-component system invasion response regulator UvrY
MSDILIADDHPLMRAGTRQLVLNYLPDARILEADNFKKALIIVSEKPLDLAIMDIGMPGGNSVKMVEMLKMRRPKLKVLILSSYEESLYALPFIKAGADGYISKEAPEAEFKMALETVLLRSKVYLSESLKDKSLQQFMQQGKSLQDPTTKLSIREQEIVQLLIAGKGISEIAALLDIHISTASTHRARIFAKLGIDNVIDLARIYDILK